MNVAIYSRKSRFTGKGESIENQIELCREYINRNYSNTNILIYEDEGFSAATTDRPQFKKLLSDSKQKKFEVLVCYRLDRVSRNIADFSNIIEDFVNRGIDFVSIKEQFDTTTPMGRAMMYIASVFAQLERETIAERIRDNMTELAKTGRWLGGTTPTGFKSVENIKKLPDGKTRKSYYLVADDNEQLRVKTIFTKYLQLKSLTKLETYLMQNNIKTKNNKYFTRFTLKSILTNPVYATADEDMLRYFEHMGVEIYADKDDFDGRHGVIAYNKTTRVKNKIKERQDIYKWIISVGLHKGVLPGKMWISVQELLDKNSDKSYRMPKTNKSLLSGLLYCLSCGSIMRPKIHRKGSEKFSYICDLKMKSNGTVCGQKNLNGCVLDDLVIDVVRNLIIKDGTVSKWLSSMSDTLKPGTDLNDNVKLLQKVLDKNKKDVLLLIDKLKYTDNAVIGEITSQIVSLQEASKKIELELKELGKANNSKGSVDYTAIENNYLNAFDNMDLCEKRDVLRVLIKKITARDEDITVIFNELFP